MYPQRGQVLTAVIDIAAILIICEMLQLLVTCV
jgi:hypothetical protein